MITPKELEQLGYRRFEWNNGAILEYWKPLGDDDDFEHRLGVRFGEWRHIPHIVYIWSRIGGYKFKHIETTSQLEQVYRLIVGGENGTY